MSIEERKHPVPKSRRNSKYWIRFDIHISQETLYHIFNIGHVAEGYDSRNKSKVEWHVVDPMYLLVQQFAVETLRENLGVMFLSVPCEGGGERTRIFFQSESKSFARNTGFGVLVSTTAWSFQYDGSMSLGTWSAPFCQSAILGRIVEGKGWEIIIIVAKQRTRRYCSMMTGSEKFAAVGAGGWNKMRKINSFQTSSWFCYCWHVGLPLIEIEWWGVVFQSFG